MQQQGHTVKYPGQRYYPWEAGAVLGPLGAADTTAIVFCPTRQAALTTASSEARLIFGFKNLAEGCQPGGKETAKR